AVALELLLLALHEPLHLVDRDRRVDDVDLPPQPLELVEDLEELLLPEVHETRVREGEVARAETLERIAERDALEAELLEERGKLRQVIRHELRERAGGRRLDAALVEAVVRELDLVAHLGETAVLLVSRRRRRVDRHDAGGEPGVDQGVDRLVREEPRV